jgi:putative membrane protein
MNRTRARTSAYELALLAIVAVVFVWSGISPRDRFTWVLEVFPVILAIPILICVYPRFRFTPLLYTLIALHATILLAGGKYTYAEVPFGFWMKETFHDGADRRGHGLAAAVR